MSSRLALLSAFVRRDWAIARSYRFGFGLQLLDALVYLVLFFFLGRVVDGPKLGHAAGLSAQSYVSFVVIGLVVFEVLHVGMNSFAAKLRQDQMTGTLEALFVTPTPASTIMLAGASYDFLRASAISGLFLLVGVLGFGVSLSANPSTTLLLVTVPAALSLFCALGVGVAAVTVRFRQATALSALLSSGLAVLGGVYFPVGVMPGVLHAAALASPLTWVLNVTRAELLGGTVPLVQLLLLLAAGVLALPLSLRLFASSLRGARAAGSLAQY